MIKIQEEVCLLVRCSFLHFLRLRLVTQHFVSYLTQKVVKTTRKMKKNEICVCVWEGGRLGVVGLAIYKTINDQLHLLIVRKSAAFKINYKNIYRLAHTHTHTRSSSTFIKLVFQSEENHQICRLPPIIKLAA